MAGPNFVSPGAMGGNAIQEFLMQREQMERQRMLDALLQQRQAQEQQMREAQIGLQREQMSGVQEDRRTAQSNLERERDFRRDVTVDQTAMPGDVFSPEMAESFERSGLGSRLRRVPGVVQQGPQVGTVDDDVPLYDVTQTPETIQHRGGSQYLAARTAAEERAAMAAQAQAATAERATADRESRESQAEAARNVQMLIAQLAASGRADTTGLRNELLRIQTQMAQTELDGKQRDVTQQRSGVAADRSRVRDLAQGLIDDPALGSITGPIEGRRDTFLQGTNADAVTRFNQLVKSLALTERSKLKGQGTITDYEARMLEQAISALNRAAGPDITKQRLQDIVTAFQGDAPNAGQAQAPGLDPLLDELLGGR